MVERKRAGKQRRHSRPMGMAEAWQREGRKCRVWKGRTNHDRVQCPEEMAGKEAEEGA